MSDREDRMRVDATEFERARLVAEALLQKADMGAGRFRVDYIGPKHAPLPPGRYSVVLSFYRQGESSVPACNHPEACKRGDGACQWCIDVSTARVLATRQAAEAADIVRQAFADVFGDVRDIRASLDALDRLLRRGEESARNVLDGRGQQ